MTTPNSPIAIVGMACRFAGGANNPSKLWELVETSRDVVSEIPNNRFNIERCYHKDGTHHGTTNVRTSYLLDQDIAQFDANFFAIPPSEAEIIDPQQRLLLEVVYEAVDAGGFSLQTLSGSNTGVFVGLMYVATVLGVYLPSSDVVFTPSMQTGAKITSHSRPKTPTRSRRTRRRE